MSTDKELLELAAKAAGKYGLRYVNNEPIQGGCRTGLWCDLEEQCWNPLTDNGQALELAVKLKMDVDQGEIGTRDGAPAAVVHYRRILKSGQLVWSSCAECSNDNPFAATRRAIVRGAAKIGEKMP